MTKNIFLIILIFLPQSILPQTNSGTHNIENISQRKPLFFNLNNYHSAYIDDQNWFGFKTPELIGFPTLSVFSEFDGNYRVNLQVGIFISSLGYSHSIFKDDRFPVTIQYNLYFVFSIPFAHDAKLLFGLHHVNEKTLSLILTSGKSFINETDDLFTHYFSMDIFYEIYIKSFRVGYGIGVNYYRFKNKVYHLDSFNHAYPPYSTMYKNQFGLQTGVTFYL